MKSIVYRPVKPPFRRASQCRRQDGKDKQAFPTRRRAGAVQRARQADGIHLEVYQCGECQQWHLGNPRGPEPTPYTFRVVDREPALLVELGERTTVQMLAESKGGDSPVRRRRLLATRARKSSLSGASETGGAE